MGSRSMKIAAVVGSLSPGLPLLSARRGAQGGDAEDLAYAGEADGEKRGRGEEGAMGTPEPRRPAERGRRRRGGAGHGPPGDLADFLPPLRLPRRCRAVSERRWRRAP